MKKTTSMILLASVSFFAVPAIAADPMSPAQKSGAPQASPSQSSSEQQGSATKAELVGKSVVDSKGAEVGKIKDVVIDAQGLPTDVLVSTGKKDVLVPAAEMQVASNDTIKTIKSAKEIKNLPAASRLPPSDATDSMKGGAPSGQPGSAPGGTAPY